MKKVALMFIALALSPLIIIAYAAGLICGFVASEVFDSGFYAGQRFSNKLSRIIGQTKKARGRG